MEVVHRDIKNLHVGVYPPSGRVRVAAPWRLDEDAVRLAVISRLGWIRRKQAGFQQQAASLSGSSSPARVITLKAGATGLA